MRELPPPHVRAALRCAAVGRGAALHCREMGFAHPLFDLIDERALSLGEVLQYLTLLFGARARLPFKVQHPLFDFLCV